VFVSVIAREREGRGVYSAGMCVDCVDWLWTKLG
jgi:hypothetical protein